MARDTRCATAPRPWHPCQPGAAQPGHPAPGGCAERLFRGRGARRRSGSPVL